jgi:hypothetical protein
MIGHSAGAPHPYSIMSNPPMTSTACWLHPFWILAVFVVHGLMPTTYAAEAVLRGTQPLTIEQPLDEVMVDGIDRFASRELAASPALRDRAWRRDFSSIAAYATSIAPHREILREWIGAVDSQVAGTDFEVHLQVTGSRSATYRRRTGKCGEGDPGVSVVAASDVARASRSGT